MVYVDSMQAKFKTMVMCHMVADTLDELHEMAEKLGLKREWFQNQNKAMPHYDISKSKRQLAIEYGAKEIGIRELINIILFKENSNIRI